MEQRQLKTQISKLKTHMNDLFWFTILLFIVAAALRSDAVRARIAEQGADVVGGSPEEFGKFLRDETDRLSAVIRRANIHLD